MSKPLRPATAAAALILSTSVLAGCADPSTSGSGGGSGASDPGSAKVAFLMPDLASTRYELYDAPLFNAKMGELCPGCEVIYQNADTDAAKQQQQANSALAQGVERRSCSTRSTPRRPPRSCRPRSPRACPVIAYDRPIPDKPADYYVSFDNEAIGASIAQSLVDHLDETGAKGGILQVNGSPTDAAAGLIKDGVHSVVDDERLRAARRVRHPGLGARQGPAVGGRPDHASTAARSPASSPPTTAPAAAPSRRSRPREPRSRRSPATTPSSRRSSGSSPATSTTPSPSRSRPSPRPPPRSRGASSTATAPDGETTLFDTPSQLFEPTVVTQDNVAEVIFGRRRRPSRLTTCAPARTPLRARSSASRDRHRTGRGRRLARLR